MFLFYVSVWTVMFKFTSKIESKFCFFFAMFSHSLSMMHHFQRISSKINKWICLQSVKKINCCFQLFFFFIGCILKPKISNSKVHQNTAGDFEIYLKSFAKNTIDWIFWETLKNLTPFRPLFPLHLTLLLNTNKSFHRKSGIKSLSFDGKTIGKIFQETYILSIKF